MRCEIVDSLNILCVRTAFGHELKVSHRIICSAVPETADIDCRRGRSSQAGPVDLFASVHRGFAPRLGCQRGSLSARAWRERRRQERKFGRPRIDSATETKFRKLSKRAMWACARLQLSSVWGPALCSA
jgi:hypothetical protein